MKLSSLDRQFSDKASRLIFKAVDETATTDLRAVPTRFSVKSARTVFVNILTVFITCVSVA